MDILALPGHFVQKQTFDVGLFEDLRKKLPGRTTSAPTFATKKSEEEEANRVAARKNLESHAALIQLLSYKLDNSDWPPHDRVADMRPKDGYVVPKNQGETGPTSTSRKRSFDHDEPTSRKRSKV